jgi:hypothetical protein
MARLQPFEIHEAPRRFSDDAFALASERPVKEHTPHAHAHAFTGSTCPFCNQQILTTRTSITSLFAGGVRRLFLAISMILSAVCRCLRFVVGSCFCLVGLIGYCCRLIGLRIVHPEDRRLLAPASRTTRTNRG